MKMKQEHYQRIKEAIAALPRGDVFIHAELLKHDDSVKDLATRLRWDLFHACGVSKWACDNLYPYLNDSHIDTALKQISKDLNFAIEG